MSDFKEFIKEWRQMEITIGERIPVKLEFDIKTSPDTPHQKYCRLECPSPMGTLCPVLENFCVGPLEKGCPLGKT